EARIQEEEEADELYRVESIFTTASSPIVSLQTPTPIMTLSTIATITTSSDAPIPPTTIPSIILENLPTFDSVFRFDERLKSLETTFSEYRQTNLFVDVVSVIPGIVHQYMAQQMTEAVREAVQIQTDRLQDSFQRENDEFLRTIDENMKKIIKGTSYAVATDLSETELKKILIEKMEGNKSIQRSDEQQNLYKAKDPSQDQTGGLKDEEKEGSMHQLALYLKQLPRVQADLPQGAEDQPIVQTSQHPEWFSQPRRPPTSNHDWNKTLPAAQENAQSWISVLAKQTDARSSFNELLDTLIDFYNFIMNRLGVDTLTPELLAGPTYELMRRSYYGHIKWIEDLAPRAMWIQEPINYDRHALWGISHWGRKRQQFYGFSVNRESALDVYSKRRIIAVTELKIVEWHNYKHLDWISDVYKEHSHSSACGRSLTGSQKLPEEAQPYNARHVSIQSKATDGTLNDVRNALDDCLKGIRMQYFSTTIWRRGDKDRATAMIQAIDKMLKTRRIIRSLEKFVGGRLYEGDFCMLQRTI
nr:hypothetical protein [Tanacetum cinerariifolium]